MNAIVNGLSLEVAGFSERGPRPENQDAFTIGAFAETSLIALADGMGGEKSGRVAAETTLHALTGLAPIRSVDQARRAVREANEAVIKASVSDPRTLGGMGCALGFLSFVDRGDGPGWIVAHVGDVRVFSRSPDGLLRLETRDHTPAFARWEAGEISLDEIPDTAGANRLQRAVGRGGEADVDWLPAAPGWSWLIVSDGVYKAMRLDELADAMAGRSADEICEAIRRKVTERGPEDNYTAVIARAAGDDAATLPSGTDRGARTSTPEPMNDSRRSGSSSLAIFLAVLALLASGAALGLLVSGGAARGEVPRLRAEVDSLRTVVEQLSRPIDPFGPSLPLNPGVGPAPPVDTPSTPSQP